MYCLYRGSRGGSSAPLILCCLYYNVAGITPPGGAMMASEASAMPMALTNKHATHADVNRSHDVRRSAFFSIVLN